MKDSYNAMVPITAPTLESIFNSHLEADKARAILAHLFFVRLMMLSNENFAPGVDRDSGYCPVLAENLKLIVRDYSDIIKVLINHDIIEYKKNEKNKKSFYPNMYSMLYRVKLGPLITNANQQRYRLEKITHKNVRKAISRYYTKDYENQQKLLLAEVPWYAKNIEFLHSLEIQCSDEQIRESAPEKYEQLIGWRQQFNDQIGRFLTKAEYDGRIHHHLSSLPKKLRMHLRLKGDTSDLQSADISCSQPFFLATALVHPELVKNILPEFLPILHTIERYKDAADVRLFHHISSEGQLYETLMKASGLTRDEAKDGMFHHILFCPASDHHDDPVVLNERIRFRNVFKSLFPNVFKVVVELKRQKKQKIPWVFELSKKNGKRGRMYILVNVLIARLESAIVLDRFVKNCSIAGIGMGTIHDGVIVRSVQILKIQKIFQSVFIQMGIRQPKLTVEPLFVSGNNIEPQKTEEK